MKKTGLLGAMTAATFAVAGCSIFHTQAVAKDCDTNADCAVTVVVTPRDGTPACTIADPGDIHVPSGKKPEIVWRIQNDGGGQFKFARQTGAVALKSGTWAPVFDDKGAGGSGGPEYRVKDKNNQKKARPSDPPFRFPYKITVVKPDDTPGCFLDPVIVNEGCDPNC